MNEFASQADITVVFVYESVRKYQAKALKGTYSVSEAIELLLADTPLKYDFRDTDHLVITYDAVIEANEETPSNNIFSAILNALAGVVGEQTVSQQDPKSSIDDQYGPRYLEEIIVTGRKREESLREIPVSISVLGSSQLAELNVLRQGDLAALVPGFHYNQGVGAAEDRTAALPSIRGIGSTELFTNRSKVATFIDGMPILGSIGAINIGSASQVEVYRGPQSAAFGRSTFAGAINYVTADPGEEFEGSAGINWSNDGTRIINGSFGGPISDTLGFQVGVSVEDSGSPDSDLYSYTDGVEAITETGENLSARFVWTPSDKFKARFSYAKDTTDDGPRSDFYASAESSFECYNQLDVIAVRLPVGPPNNLTVVGDYECDLEVHTGTVLEQLNDYSRYFDNNPDALQLVVDDLIAQGVTETNGLSVEEQARILYDGYSVVHGDVGSDSDRDRFTAQFEYVLDNGGDIALSLMITEEESFRGVTRIAEQEVQSFLYDDANEWFNYQAQVARATPANQTTDIEETYAELRWASPAEARLRYVVGASYYSYEYLFSDFTAAPGYNNLLNGTAEEFAMLINPEELAPSGGVVGASAISTEETTNIAAFFNASYDFSDTVTASIEGRYSSDDVGAIAENPAEGLTFEDSVTTKTFSPRLAVNWTPTDDLTVYAQYSIGVNPAGINSALLDNRLTYTLDNGFLVALDPIDNPDVLTLYTPDVNYSSETYTSFDEETLTNYEIGIKGSALDGNMTYEVAAYFMEWDDAIETFNLDWDHPNSTNNVDEVGTPVDPDNDPTGPVFINNTAFTSAANIQANSGASDVYGMEFQINYRFNDNWSLITNGAYMKREYTNFCSEGDVLIEKGAIVSTQIAIVGANLELGESEGGNDCWVLDGLEAPKQPNFNLTIIPRYRTEIGNGLQLTASTMLRHTGRQLNEFSNTTVIPEQNRVNLNLGLSGDNWSGNLYIDNLLDDTGVIPRGGTSDSRFSQLHGFDTPEVLQYGGDEDGNGADGRPLGEQWASWRMTVNEGRTFGVRLNYFF